MTQNEQLVNEKIRAEISNLFAEALKNAATSEQIRAETNKARIDAERLHAEINKTLAETAKIRTEKVWIPVTVASAATAGTIVAVGGLIQLLS